MRVAQKEIGALLERRLSRRYAVIQLDAVYFPLKHDRVEKEAVYVTLAIQEDGHRQILGYWLPGGNEAAENFPQARYQPCENADKYLYVK